jgi:hypothetical protein
MVTQQPPSTHNEKIDVKYDKFKDATIVVLWKMKLGAGALGSLPEPGLRYNLQLSIISHYSGRNAPVLFADSVLFSFEYGGPVSLMSTHPDLILLVDDHRDVLTVRQGITVLPSRDWPAADVTIPPDLLVRLCKAKKIEGQLGPVEFHFDQSNFAALRDFENRLHQ